MNNNIYKQNQAFFNQPYRLTPEQQQNPLPVIESFFDSMHLYQARESLTELLEMALTCTNPEYANGMDRANVIHFCHQLEDLVEVVYVLRSRL
jgi:hypothetical protein